MLRKFGGSFIAIIFIASVAFSGSAKAQQLFLRADFNGDGVVDCEDIDAWNWAYNLYSADPITFAAWTPILDLSSSPFNNGNNRVVSTVDRHVLVREILDLAYGDANCDGVVDVADMSIVANNFGQSGKGWAEGDFNGDGTVDGEDADAVNRNWLLVGNDIDEGDVIIVGDVDRIDLPRGWPENLECLTDLAPLECPIEEGFHDDFLDIDPAVWFRCDEC